MSTMPLKMQGMNDDEPWGNKKNSPSPLSIFAINWSLFIDKEKKSAVCSGNGPVDATFNAIKELTNTRFRLKLYQVHAITEGTDAQGEVTVRLGDENLSSQSKGSDPDIIVASAKAYINSLCLIGYAYMKQE